MSQLGVGLIGGGAIALSAHVPALSALGSLAHLINVCDVRAEVAEATASRLGVPRWTTDFRQLLADPAVEVVIIATPEFLHAEQTIAAVDAGKHVLCEKPIAATLAEADAMIAAADKAGIHFMVAHSRRFTARYMTIRKLLDRDTVGELVLIRENERRPRAQYAPLNLAVDFWQPNPERNQPWQDMARYSGGVARGHAIHEMDLFRWFAGSEGRAISAESKITIPDREVADAISFHLEFANGVLASCDLYTQAPPGYPYYHQLEIIGTKGMLRARDTDMITLTRFDRQGMQFPTAFSSLLHITDAYINEQRLFFESILNDGPVPLDPREGRAALELALAATQAADTGQRVGLPLPAPGTEQEATWTS